MKKNKTLINILHRLFAGLLVIMSLFLLINIGFDIFTDNGKVGNFSGTHHSNGYPIPVTINTRVNKPIFNNEISLNVKKHVSKGGRKGWSSNPKYVDILPDDINDGTKNILSFHFDSDKEYFHTKASSFRSDGYIIAKSENKLISFLQIFKAYIGLFSLIIILFFLERIFFRLKKSLSFTNNLYKEVRWLGAVFIISESLSLLFSYVLSTYYGRIGVKTLIEGKRLSDGLELSINPRLEFDFAFFVVGLSLLVLASLLKSGNQLQQENDLTI
ncbi:DUF2975 domain-containing protein [Olleya namhaensis]|uniref:DUF2975 domain-containing protein n=1 Tax=Olleya namhaensis TaxID=1144750 RepID=A0A1I3J363_9FLAO|nr:DUF2975 domain-containing protein [Olleya namhaensis]SFI54694.1 Protein of unknown function [Olleya namhaensis]